MAATPELNPSETADHNNERGRFLALFSAVMLPMFLAAVDQTILAVATPQIGREFSDMNGISWLAVAYLLASVVMVPLYGRLADRFGRRRLLAVALGVFSGGSLACTLAPSLDMLIAARALQGAGGAGLMSLSHALIGEILRPRERARYQGYFAVVFATASLVGPLLGGIVVQMGNWRWLFAFNLPLCLFAGWRLARLPTVVAVLDPTGRVDVKGGLLFAAAAALSLWLISRSGGVTMLSGWGIWAVPAIAGLLWLALWWVEKPLARPYLPLELLRLPVMRYSALATGAYAAAMFSLVFYLPAYVQLAFASSPAQSGMLLVPLTGGTIVGSTLAGRIVLRSGRTRELPLTGLLLAGLSLALLSVMPPSRPLVLVLGFSTGLGFGMVMSITQIISQIAAGPARLGSAAAVISLSRNMGAAVGAAAFGAIAFGFQGSIGGLMRGPAAATATSGYHAAFMVAAAVCGLGAWAAYRLPRDRLPSDTHRARSGGDS